MLSVDRRQLLVLQVAYQSTQTIETVLAIGQKTQPLHMQALG
jgi:hypothetical protein